MSVNIELLDKVMDHIEHNQELWEQSTWAGLVVNGYSSEDLRRFVAEDPDNPACGTALCFAGHACNASGWHPLFDITGFWFSAHTGTCKNKAGEMAPIEDKAKELLGISWDTAEKLFAGENSLETLRNMVAHLKAKGNLDDFDDYVHDDEVEEW